MLLSKRLKIITGENRKIILEINNIKIELTGLESVGLGATLNAMVLSKLNIF